MQFMVEHRWLHVACQASLTRLLGKNWYSDAGFLLIQHTATEKGAKRDAKSMVSNERYFMCTVNWMTRNTSASSNARSSNWSQVVANIRPPFLRDKNRISACGKKWSANRSRAELMCRLPLCERN